MLDFKRSRQGNLYAVQDGLVAFITPCKDQDGFTVSIKVDHRFQAEDEAQVFAQDVMDTLSDSRLSRPEEAE